MKPSKSSHYAIFATSLLFFSQPSLSQSFTPPEEVIQFGHVYKLAFKKIIPNKRALYEYTSNGESIEKWTSLVTFTFTNGQENLFKKWPDAIKKSLTETNPLPYYKLYEKNNSTYVKIIFEPISNDPTYESDIQKLFFFKDCNGLLNYQYAVKYPKGSDQSEEGKLATLNSIKEENVKMESEMEAVDWSSTCR